MKKLTDFLSEVEGPRTERDRRAMAIHTIKKTDYPVKDGGEFEVKTKKDHTKKASYADGADVTAYDKANGLSVREEIISTILGLVSEEEQISESDIHFAVQSYMNSLKPMDRLDIHKKANNGELKTNVKNLRNTHAYVLKHHKSDVDKHLAQIQTESVEQFEEISATGAKVILDRHDAHGDFFSLDSSKISALHSEAKKAGYRGSKNGASLGRNFHQHLKKKAAKVNEELETLDEISKERLADYIKKSGKNLDKQEKTITKKKDLIKTYSNQKLLDNPSTGYQFSKDMHTDDLKKAKNKRSNRAIGLYRAKDKLNKDD